MSVKSALWRRIGVADVEYESAATWWTRASRKCAREGLWRISAAVNGLPTVSL